MHRRSYENLQKAIYQGVGEYQIPEIQPLTEMPAIREWLRFDQATNQRIERADLQEYGVHFFVDDFLFNRVWDEPDKYVQKLAGYGVVLSPDFSTFTDFPMVMQLYNHYRKHWLAAYWQDNGVTVVPTISWSDHDSYRWCFDGEPTESIVAVSAVGTQREKDTKQLFLDGYTEMMHRLRPKAVIFQGPVPPGCRGNIIKIPTVWVNRGPRFREEWVGL